MLSVNTDEADFHRNLDEKLELLQQLSDDTDRWLEDELYEPSISDATASSITLPFEYEEENADACEACVYDPALFPPSSPTRGSLAVGIFPITSDRDKPLPSTPNTFEYRLPPPPPSTPGYGSPVSSSPPTTPLSPTFSSSVSSSPRVPHTPPRTSSLLYAPRPRPRSSRMSVGSARSTLTHSTFPSISSTLSHLEERETDVAKRSGVYVTDAERGAEEPAEDTVAPTSVRPHVLARKSSKELLKLQSFISVAESETSDASHDALQRVRSELPVLSTSHSSPQLRTLADLAAIPASPIRTVSSASTATTTTASSQTTTRQHTLTRSFTFPTDVPDDASLSSTTMSATTLAAGLSSRWSLDSTHSARPITSNPLSPVAEAQESPMKPRKRDRLISFISRNRAGSVGKSSQPPVPADPDYADLVGFQPEFFVGTTTTNASTSHTKRHSRIASQPSTSSLNLPMQQPESVVPPLPLPPPISLSASGSSSGSASGSRSASTSTLPTPIDGSPTMAVLPPPAFFASEPSSYLPEIDDGEYDELEMVEDVPLPPTLPLPSPSVPTASFLLPQRPQSAFPFLSALRRKNRRHKKLVINDFAPPSPTTSSSSLSDDREKEDERAIPGIVAARRESRAAQQKERYDAIVRWCERFGTLRRVEERRDGSLHIHWKEWEAADMVCRIQGQVYINDVGTVNMTWHYLK
ncbi:hypothetical protein EIP91_011460 [Steccherinum ochraceum]|uniref:Uncharacterized protein n=1 Tax=Steccherinum ochraceum TaxID=92696 RepID=A0A4R0RLY3_9APHY|nr:hypothetical protein EIP91_011460 [Steccherinum ochraceum]